MNALRGLVKSADGRLSACSSESFPQRVSASECAAFRLPAPSPFVCFPYVNPRRRPLLVSFKSCSFANRSFLPDCSMRTRYGDCRTFAVNKYLVIHVFRWTRPLQLRIRRMQRSREVQPSVHATATADMTITKRKASAPLDWPLPLELATTGSMAIHVSAPSPALIGTRS